MAYCDPGNTRNCTFEEIFGQIPQKKFDKSI